MNESSESVYMKVDGSDENGQKCVNVDEQGLKWMRVDGNIWKGLYYHPEAESG